MASTSNNTAKKLEKEIIRLKADVDEVLVDVAEDDMTSELRDLRHKILIAHSEIQSFLELHLLYDTLTTANPMVTKRPVMTSKEIQEYGNKMKKLIKTMTFSRLLDVVNTLGVLNKKLISNIRKLNKSRVHFAHPKEKEYLIYNDKKEYKAVFENIKEILIEIKSNKGNLKLKVKEVK